jgi:hypothetical protein
VELVVVEMVVVVVVSPTVIALFLDVSPDGPDVFPRVLVLSGFAFRSPCLSIVVLPPSEQQPVGQLRLVEDLEDSFLFAVA